MIKLFHIPTHKIDTAEFDNLLHGKIVTEFEQRFADYVGAKYAVSFSSATNAILIVSSLVAAGGNDEISVPSILPPVVVNAFVHGRNDNELFLNFKDEVDWVGRDYILFHFNDSNRLIDSAHRVDKDQYKNEAKNSDVMLFSFFPTKPVSGSDGGMIVSDDKETIDCLRLLSKNGMSEEGNSWDRELKTFGYKMYMNSSQAYIANENLKNLDSKKAILAKIREGYNVVFGLNNTSDHLYRIKVADNVEFVKKAQAAGIQCGIHYKALHQMPIFQYYGPALPKSEEAARTMVSLPFHEELTLGEINTVIEFVIDNKC